MHDTLNHPSLSYLLHALNANSLQGILVVDSSGEILCQNQRFHEIWNIPPQLAARNEDQGLLAYVQDQLADPTGFLTRVRQLYLDPDQISLETLELKGLRFLRRYSTPLRSPENELLGRIWYFEDITEAERTRRQLEESQLRFQDLFEHMNDGFALHKIILDSEGKPVDYEFLECNQVFLSRLGMSREQIVGQRCLKLFPKTEPVWIEAFGKVALTGEPLQFTHYSLELDRHYTTNLYCPRLGFFAGLFTDVTAMCKAEEDREALIATLKSKNQELEHFAHTVSHDLRSPLVTIQGFAAEAILALDNARPLEAARDLEMVRSASNRMGKLLADLLEFSRIGRDSTRTTTLDMCALVEEAWLTVKHLPGAESAKLQYPRNLGKIHSTGHRIVQIWQNLLENAIKYRRPGVPATISLTMEETEDGLLYRMSDNGQGIDRRYQEKVFNLFEQLNRNSPGTGAGLAITRRIVEAEGGSICLESEVGHGTTILIQLPNRP